MLWFKCRHRLVAVTLIAVVCFAAVCYAKLQPQADVNLADYRGRWVVVNIWAGWCAPCMDELPELEVFYQDHSDQVAVLGLSFDHLGLSDLQQFAKQHHITFPLVSDLPLRSLGIQEVAQVPMTIVISPQGDVAQVLMGPQTREQLLAAIPVG